jgi:hypothetical protein
MKGEAKMEKNALKGLLTLVCAIFIAGCASGPIGKLSPIVDEKRSGEITVIRVSSIVGVANSYIVTLNGTDVFAIRSGQYTKFKFNEGEHYIGIKCFGGWSPTWKQDSLRFTIAPNSSLYFLVSPNMSCASIVSIAEADGRNRMQSSEYVSMEQ